MRDRDTTKTTLWLMRHGPTDWNREKRLQGRKNSVILLDQIDGYFDRVRATTLPRPDGIIVTGLVRTAQTASALQKYNDWEDITVAVNEQLVERSWGELEGKQHGDLVEIFSKDPGLMQKHPDLHTLDDLAPILDAPGFTGEGGETMDQVRERVSPALLGYHETHTGQTLLLILHAAVIKSQGFDYGKVTEVEVFKDDQQQLTMHRVREL